VEERRTVDNAVEVCIKFEAELVVEEAQVDEED
jgi:hypothetical protein